MSRELFSPAYRRAELAWLAVLLAAFFFIALVTYSHLGEDAFISFRYARNLAHGWGFVYNRGERVEGFSNLLWVLLIAPFELVGIRAHLAARVMSTLFFGGAVVMGWWTARRLVQADRPAWVAWWLPVAVALEPYLHYHDDRGLETVPFAALLAAAMFVVGGGGTLWIAGALAGLATITRPEGIGFAIALMPAVSIRATNGRWWKPDRTAIRAAVRYAAIPLGFFALQMAFRLVHFHGLVPNTVIAKRPSGGGLSEIIALACSHAFVPVFGFAGCVLGMRHARFRALAAGCLGLMLATWMFQLRAGTLLNVGFRYQAPIFIPAVVGCWLLVTQLADAFELDRNRGAAWRVALVLSLLLLLLVPATIFRDGAAYRFFRGNGDAPRSRVLSRLIQPGTYNVADRLRWYLSDPIYVNAEAGRWARAHLPSQALLAADQMGQVGYFANPEQPFVDLLGLMDKEIARNGLSASYLLQRRPAYLIVEACLDSTYWPESWRLKPHVATLWPVFDDPAFRAQYRPRWLLKPDWSFAQIGFMVYVRRDLDDGAPREDVVVGVDEKTFEKDWRVLGGVVDD